MARGKGTKPASVKLNDSINIPLNRGLKKRIIALAKLHPAEPSYTRYARMLLERAVELQEQHAAAAEQHAAAVPTEPETDLVTSA